MRWGLGRDMSARAQEEYIEKIPFSIETVTNEKLPSTLKINFVTEQLM